MKHAPIAVPNPLGDLLATDLALGSVNRVLASLDRLEARGEQIDAVLADYRAIPSGRAFVRCTVPVPVTAVPASIAIAKENYSD